MADGDQTTWMIGRHPECDIHIGNDTVSRFHAELIVGRNGRPFLVDRLSTHGTWVKDEGKWSRLGHGAYLDGNTSVRLGTHETTVRELIAGIPRR